MSYKGYIAIIGAITTSICVLFGIHQISDSKNKKYQDTKKEKLVKTLQEEGYDYYTASKKATEILNDDYNSLQRNMESTGSPAFDDLVYSSLGFTPIPND